MLGPRLGQAFGPPDVLGLSALVAAAQQDDQRVPAPLEIDPIARAVVDAQLTDPIPDRFGVARVSVSQPIQPRENDADGALVLQPRPSLPKRLCLLQLDHM